MKALYNKIGLLVAAALVFASCGKYEPVPDYSAEVPTLENAHVVSITELLGTFPGNGPYGYDSIPQYVDPADSSLWDYYIFVEVLANDISGNLYKSLYVRDLLSDTNGVRRALNISTDKTGLYNYYPVGQKLYIKCSGLCRGEYGGLPQLGYRYQDDNRQWKLGRIPDQMFTDHVIKYGPAPSDPDSLPKPIEINDVSELKNPALYSQLVLLHNVRFMPDAVNQQFAPAPPVGSNPTSVDRLFTVNGEGSGLTLRTSTACRFFADTIPPGFGDMVCIYTIYNSTKQFYLRERSDLAWEQFKATADIDRPVFFESFSNGLSGFTAVSKSGSAKWESAIYGGGCVMLRGQNTGANVDWLYSPVINLPDTMNRIEASFMQCVAYASGRGTEICTFRITDNVDAADPTQAEWETLTIPKPFTGTGWDFQPTGRIDISKYKGKAVRVAFVFDDPSAVEATWELNQLEIVANKE